MQDSIFSNGSKLGLGLCFLVSLALGIMDLWTWAFGVVISGFWVFLNLFSLIKLIQISLSQNKKVKNKILIFWVFKFPVLYIAGFFILKTRFFPIYSVLIGLTLFLAAFCLGYFKENLALSVERNVS